MLVFVLSFGANKSFLKKPLIIVAHNAKASRGGLVVLTPLSVVAGTSSPVHAFQPSISDGPFLYPWLLVAVLAFVFVVSVLLLFSIRRRQQLSARLERIRREALLLYDEAPCGYHALDDNGVFTNVNATFCRWMGYEKEELVGKVKFPDLVEGGREEVKHSLEALNAGRPWVDIDVVKKSGERLPLMLGKFNMQSLPGPAREVFCTLDNRRCYEALERIKTLDHELESFSYSISHDLRAPLRSIDGYAKILQEDFAPALGDEGRRVLGVVMNNAGRMGALIDDLLEYGRLGRKEVHPAKVDMTAIVKEVAEDCRAVYSDRTIDVRVGELHTAAADSEMIRVVWRHLIDNAMKFSANQERALVEIRSFIIGSDEVCYEVKDNGVGFDMQYAGKLFGVFQRLHRIQDFGGTGVGLAIVKRIVGRHGGRIWGEGSLQKGAIFYFTLPFDHGNA